MGGGGWEKISYQESSNAALREKKIKFRIGDVIAKSCKTEKIGKIEINVHPS